MLRELGALVGLLTDELLEGKRSLGHRIAAWLLRESRGGRNRIQATQARVAAQVGAERANVSRELAQLKRDGTVRLGRGWIEVLRADDLRLVALRRPSRRSRPR